MTLSDIFTNFDYDFGLATGGSDVITFAQLPSDQQDALRNSSGIDAIVLGGSNDDAFDDAGSRIYFGNAGNDYIDGDAGNDTISGGQDFDTLLGFSGDDVLAGNLGNDELYGEDGDDFLFGGQDDDYVNGGAGNDLVSGDRGNDIIDGGQGLNELYGGEGADLFYVGDDAMFTHQSFIEDFNPAEDTIAVWGIPLSDVQLLDHDFGVVLYDSLLNFEFAAVTGFTASQVVNSIVSFEDEEQVIDPVTTPNPQPTPVAGEFELQVLDLVNQERASFGLSPLAFDPLLAQAAETHSQNMAFQDFFSHTGADGSRFSDRIQATGFQLRGASAENIAAGQASPAAVVDGWMNSPGHRANILTADFTLLGVGHYYLENDTGSTNYNHYWTQVFSA